MPKPRPWSKEQALLRWIWVGTPATTHAVRLKICRQESQQELSTLTALYHDYKLIDGLMKKKERSV